MPYTTPCKLVRLCRFTAASAFALAASCASAASQWDIRDLGTLPGGTYSVGTGINDAGQVIGFGDRTPVFTDAGEPVSQPGAFISGMDGGALSDLGFGPEAAGFTSLRPVAVNNAGQVAGNATQGSSTPLGFLTGPDGSALDFLTGEESGAFFTTVTDINSDGEVLYETVQGAVGVLRPDGSAVEIRNAGEPGAARAINDAGQVALNAQPDPVSAQVNGFIWSQADGFQFVRADGAFSEVYDINNAGQALAAGADGIFIAAAGGGTLDFLDLPDGSVIDNSLGLPRFNDSGQVIGRLRGADGGSFAFVTGADGDGFTNIGMLPDLMLAGLSDLTLTGINNLGQLAGTAIIDGQQRAIFLAPVPEPETYALMLAGLGVIAWAGKRRSKKVSASAC